MRRKDIVLTILRAAVALTLFLIAILNYDRLSGLDVTKLLAFTQNVWLLSAAVLGVYFVKALVFVIPASVVYVAVGAMLPTGMAVAVNLLGILIEVSATYVLGRFLGKDAVYRLLSKKETGRKLLEKNVGDKASVLLVIRAVPAFPIDFVSLLYGASGAKYLRYAALSLLGVSWRVVLFTIIGDAVFKWIPMDKIILITICLIPVGVGYYLLKKFVLDPRRAKKEPPAEPTAADE